MSTETQLPCPYCGAVIETDARTFIRYRCGTDIWKREACEPSENLVEKRPMLCIRRTLIHHALRYRAKARQYDHEASLMAHRVFDRDQKIESLLMEIARLKLTMAAPAPQTTEGGDQ